MSIADIAPFNPPVSGTNYYDVHSIVYIDMSAMPKNDRQIVFMENGVNWHPITISLADDTNTLLDVATADPKTILADIANSTSLTIWTAVTPAALVILAYPVSAIRVTNNGSDAFGCQIAM